MRINQIILLSKRKQKNLSFWHLVFEWEDVFSDKLNIPIKTYHGIGIKCFNFFLRTKIGSKLFSFGYFRRFILAIFSFFSYSKNRVVLYFEMYPTLRKFSYFPMKNRIPIIIDFDYGVNLSEFYSIYADCKVVIISSLEAFNYLKKNNCPLNIYHLPLSLPDQYQFNSKKRFEKEYDIILAGRQNKVLREYLTLFENKFPQIEYLYSTVGENRRFFYKSNKRGIIGEFADRNAYFDLLTKSKIAFYSTPGIDEEKTNFINHVTSRFFEYMYAQCFIVARYPLNEEVKSFELSKIAKSVNNYEEFEDLLLNSLHSDIKDKFTLYEDYLKNNYTSSRVNILNEIIETHI